MSPQLKLFKPKITERSLKWKDLFENEDKNKVIYSKEEKHSC